MVTLDRPTRRLEPAVIEGQLVVLRHHRPDDLPHVRRWYRDPELARLTRYSLQPMSDEEIDRFFHGRLMSPETVAYAIELRESGRLIGLTTFSNLDPDNGSVLFHISIGEHDAWGQGFGTEATRAHARGWPSSASACTASACRSSASTSAPSAATRRPASASRVALARPSCATASGATS